MERIDALVLFKAINNGFLDANAKIFLVLELRLKIFFGHFKAVLEGILFTTKQNLLGDKKIKRIMNSNKTMAMAMAINDNGRHTSTEIV